MTLSILLTSQNQCQRMFLLGSSNARNTFPVELRQLEHFIAVAEELSFTRAARRLHVVQSGVSAAIRSLERELGCALFERTSQRVRLTGAGAALLPEARATLHAAEAARDAVRAAQDTLRGTVNVGAMASVEVVDLPALLGQLHARHPAIDVRPRLATTGSEGLAHALLSGDLDVAFLSLPERKPAGIDARELATVPLVLVVNAAHPLAQRRELTLADLAEEPFVDFPPGYGNREVVDRAVRGGGHRTPGGPGSARHRHGGDPRPARSGHRLPARVRRCPHPRPARPGRPRHRAPLEHASRHVVDAAAQLGSAGAARPGRPPRHRPVTPGPRPGPWRAPHATTAARHRRSADVTRRIRRPGRSPCRAATSGR